MPAAASFEVAMPPAGVAGQLDPSILLPKKPHSDDVVARVGEVELRKSHVFDRLVELNRRNARNLIDVLIMDAVVAAHAAEHGIIIDTKAIENLVTNEEELLRERVRIEWGGRKTFEDYVLSQFDLGVDDYREFLKLELARERYRSYVIRFLALLEDRVEVRLLRNRDKKVVEDVARSVRDGADFATLAFRHSEDETRSDGGRMPPFSRTFEHPIAKIAFGLGEGEVSQPFQMELGGSEHWCLVYCLQRMPGRPGVTFDAVRDEITAGLKARALTPFEQKSFQLRWCRDAAGR